MCTLNCIEDEFHFIFICSFYASICHKFQEHFHYVRINSGCLSIVTDFLAFISPNIIFSYILDINKLRLTNNLSAVVWLFVFIMIDRSLYNFEFLLKALLLGLGVKWNILLM